jgi:aryl-alcohol dehydrogenase-like predicted oxidoreductase
MSQKEQIEENIGALGWALPKECIAELDQASSSLSAGLRSHDTLWGWHSLG